MANYIDNKKLHEVIKGYVIAYREAKAKDEPLPRIPEYVGKAAMEIATGLASRYNFSRYTYKDEMIMDGVMDIMKYLHNFKYEEYDKPFSYFNMVIWQAFVRRIQKEKKEHMIKIKAAIKSGHEMPLEMEKDMMQKMEEYESKK